MKSIIQSDKRCYLCGTRDNLHEHHIFPGANRKNSEKYGLKVYLCANHHNMSKDSVHFNPIYMKLLKIIGQLYYLLYFDFDEKFENIFYKNYREDDNDDV